MALLALEHLRVRFDTPRGRVQALDDVGFELEEGQTLGLVGESGSGKTVTALALLGLLGDNAVVETGEARFEGADLLTLPRRELARLRGRRIALCPQDPLSALNPLMTIGRQLSEVLEVHLGLPRREARRRCAQALSEVGIPEPESRLDLYPHELSGGQRQRALLAMALLCEPRVLLADEPTTALDVTLPAQVLDLLVALQERHGTAILLITHDLGVVARACQRVVVLYAGRVVEEASTDELFRAPLHPYTLGLLASVPRLDTRTDVPLRAIPGSPPDPLEPARGCAFAPRCPFQVRRCLGETPPLAPWQPGAGGALSAAHLHFFGGRRAACFESERVVQVPGLLAGRAAEEGS